MSNDQTTAPSSHGTSRLRIGMGTAIAIHAGACTGHDALVGIERAFAAVTQMEKLMPPTRAGSELLAIQQSRLGLPVGLHAWTWEVLARSWRLDQVSKGVFDPCFHRVVVRREGAGDTVVELKNAALATSDVCSAAGPAEHRGYYHGDSSAVLLETFDARVVACDFSS